MVGSETAFGGGTPLLLIEYDCLSQTAGKHMCSTATHLSDNIPPIHIVDVQDFVHL